LIECRNKTFAALHLCELFVIHPRAPSFCMSRV
jgi:hypothetical protein